MHQVMPMAFVKPKKYRQLSFSIKQTENTENPTDWKRAKHTSGRNDWFAQGKNAVWVNAIGASMLKNEWKCFEINSFLAMSRHHYECIVFCSVRKPSTVDNSILENWLHCEYCMGYIDGTCFSVTLDVRKKNSFPEKYSLIESNRNK